MKDPFFLFFDVFLNLPAFFLSWKNPPGVFKSEEGPSRDRIKALVFSKTTFCYYASSLFPLMDHLEGAFLLRAAFFFLSLPPCPSRFFQPVNERLPYSANPFLFSGSLFSPGRPPQPFGLPIHFSITMSPPTSLIFEKKYYDASPPPPRLTSPQQAPYQWFLRNLFFLLYLGKIDRSRAFFPSLSFFPGWPPKRSKRPSYFHSHSLNSTVKAYAFLLFRSPNAAGRPFFF